MQPKYYVLHINPEPWAVGSVSRGAKGARISPNPNLVAFQNAVREALDGAKKLGFTRIKITFYLWRQMAKYIDAADRVRQRNQADATNMQKGLEDALQGILMDNDRDVEDIRTVIVEQGPFVEPCIIIKAEASHNPLVEVMETIPADVLQKWADKAAPQLSGSDKWAESDDLF